MKGIKWIVFVIAWTVSNLYSKCYTILNHIISYRHTSGRSENNKLVLSLLSRPLLEGTQIDRELGGKSEKKLFMSEIIFVVINLLAPEKVCWFNQVLEAVTSKNENISKRFQLIFHKLLTWWLTCSSLDTLRDRKPRKSS